MHGIRTNEPSSPARLASAFAGFDEDKANRLIEESLTLRSVERTIEEVLLEAVGSHSDTDGPSAEYEFGWRFATGWLSAFKRLSPPAHRPEGGRITRPGPRPVARTTRARVAARRIERTALRRRVSSGLRRTRHRLRGPRGVDSLQGHRPSVAPQLHSRTSGRQIGEYPSAALRIDQLDQAPLRLAGARR